VSWCVRRIIREGTARSWAQFIIELGSPQESPRQVVWAQRRKGQDEPLLFERVEDAVAAALVHGGEVVPWTS
jgi:hypothetical protein